MGVDSIVEGTFANEQRKALRREAWRKAALGADGARNEERHEGSQWNMAVKLVEGSRDH